MHMKELTQCFTLLLEITGAPSGLTVKFDTDLLEQLGQSIAWRTVRHHAPVCVVHDFAIERSKL